MIADTSFSERLQKIFMDLGFTASEFAERIAVGRATISHIISGRNKPSLDFVLKIRKSFPEIDLYWLLEGREYMETASPISTLVTEEPTPQKTELKDAQEIHPNTSTVRTVKDKNKKDIKAIIVLYKDGSFENYVSN